MRRSILFALVLALGLSLRAFAADETYTGWPYLTADGIGSAFTLTTLPESPSAFFANPACVSMSLLPQLAHNHSARHFPGSQEGGGLETDQLDNDFESIIFPLPIGRFAYGFTLIDEHGWDYRTPPPGEFPYPRERMKGAESAAAYAVGCYPLSIGTSLRKFSREFYPPMRGSMPIPTPGQAQPSFASSLVNGEGDSIGILAGLPWLRYSQVKSRLDMRKLVLPVGMEQQARQKVTRIGWRFNPCAWMSFACEQSKQVSGPFTTPGAKGEAVTEVTKSRSFTVRPFVFVELSFGEVDGKRAWGCKLVLPGAKLKYAELKDYLGKVTGYAATLLADLHFYGVDMTIW